jgi:hypothetical protein
MEDGSFVQAYKASDSTSWTVEKQDWAAGRLADYTSLAANDNGTIYAFSAGMNYTQILELSLSGNGNSWEISGIVSTGL